MHACLISAQAQQLFQVVRLPVVRVIVLWADRRMRVPVFISYIDAPCLQTRPMKRRPQARTGRSASTSRSSVAGAGLAVGAGSLAALRCAAGRGRTQRRTRQLRPGAGPCAGPGLDHDWPAGRLLIIMLSMQLA